jgi:hypothetical protein
MNKQEEKFNLRVRKIGKGQCCFVVKKEKKEKNEKKENTKNDCT